VTSEPMAGSITVERSVSLRDVNRLADGGLERLPGCIRGLPGLAASGERSRHHAERSRPRAWAVDRGSRPPTPSRSGRSCDASWRIGRSPRDLPPECWSVSRRLLTHVRPERVAVTGGLMASDGNQAKAGGRPACPGRPSTRRSTSTASSPRRASDQAQVRPDSERAIVMYQQPPARFRAPRTRKKAAHP